MKPGTARAAALAAALVLGPPLAPLLAAQRRTAPFESISIALSLSRNVNRNSFHNQWSPGTGIGGGVELPFYAGAAELGVEHLGFRSRTPEVPGFSARYYYVGWGLEVAPASRVRLKPGIRIGSYAMRFDDASLPEGREHESEIALELLSRAAWRVDERWRGSVAAHYRVVLTEPRMRLFTLSAGISRTFDTPKWLRDFLD